MFLLLYAMAETVCIEKQEYAELLFFKKLVENNLNESVDENQINLIREAEKEKSMDKNEFLEKAQNLI